MPKNLLKKKFSLVGRTFANAQAKVPAWFDKLQVVIPNQEEPDIKQATEFQSNTCKEWMIVHHNNRFDVTISCHLFASEMAAILKYYKQLKSQTRLPLVISVGTPSLNMVSQGALAEEIQLISWHSKL